MDACFALTAWYLVGSPGVLPQSDTEAYLWAKKAAEMGLAKAQYAVGYFTEVGLNNQELRILLRTGNLEQTGVGTEANIQEAMKFYRQAAEGGDKRAQKRLQSNNRNGMSALDRRLEMEAMKEDHGTKGNKGDGCVVM